MTSLEVVQTLTAGVDNVRGHVPDGVLPLQRAGIHDALDRRLAVTLVLASLRGVPVSCVTRTSTGGAGLGTQPSPTSAC